MTNTAATTLRRQAHIVEHLVRWIVLGALVGVLAGLSSAAFIEALNWATDTRLAHGWLLYLLPAAGLAIGLVYHHLGGRSAGGNTLIIEEIHEPTEWVPRRMAPLVFGGTIVTQLFGGSTGREGTAIQMSGSLTDAASRLLRLKPADRRMMLIAALGGGFGAVFGVPIAGCVFALEVQAIGRLRYDALVPALTASLVGDMVVRGLGVHHTPYPPLGDIHLTVALVLKVAVAGVAFGLCGIAFSSAVHAVRHVCARWLSWPPIRPVFGGFGIIALVWIVGTRDYLGLSLPLIGDALTGGNGVTDWSFLAKLVFTAVTLGAGFQGGEVTPLFVIGATLGVTMARLLDVPVPILAAVGFVAVFAGAANVPLTCTVMGAELFGAGHGTVALFAIGSVMAYVCSSHTGIYRSQRVDSPKPGRAVAPPG